jgi:signal transduction histidine kinase
LEVMGHIGAQLGRVIERTRSEAELHQALQREHQAVEALRSLDEMKNAFLQAVSHDLRTPLTSILGAALTLERRDVNLSPAESHDLVQRLAANARRLDKLLSDLLDLDRLVRGIVAPNRRPTDVAALVRAVIEETDLLNEHEIQVDAKPVIAEVDAAKVERIVENLLINAVRHTPAGTMVWVRVREERSGVLITVEDAGTGVPEELREDIFQPFRQGPSPTSHSPGVGIGLSLVARFAELHGGWSRVGERPGGGASFQVFLPGSESKPAIGAFESRAGDGHQAQDAQEERISARRRG